MGSPQPPASERPPPSGSRMLWISKSHPTHRDDVILAEAQLIVIMSLEIQQGLGPAPVAP